MILNNAVQKAESMAGKINPRFSITFSQIIELSNHYPGRIEYGFSLFRLGYMQGMKAAKKELKQKEAAGCKK